MINITVRLNVDNMRYRLKVITWCSRTGRIAYSVGNQHYVWIRFVTRSVVNILRGLISYTPAIIIPANTFVIKIINNTITKQAM